MTSTKETPLEGTEQLLQRIIKNQISQGVLVHDFPGTAEAKQGILNLIQDYIDDLNELNQQALQLDVSVPRDVVQYIDDGRNPDVYTREFVELLAKQNQYVNGKMKAMGQLKRVLARHLLETYPDLAEDLAKTAG